MNLNEGVTRTYSRKILDIPFLNSSHNFPFIVKNSYYKKFAANPDLFYSNLGGPNLHEIAYIHRISSQNQWKTNDLEIFNLNPNITFNSNLNIYKICIFYIENFTHAINPKLKILNIQNPSISPEFYNYF